jgi:hypothetical protein
VFISGYDYLGDINRPTDLTYRLVAIEREAADSQHNPLVKGGSITNGLPFWISMGAGLQDYPNCNLYPGFCLITAEEQIIGILFLHPSP